MKISEFIKLFKTNPRTKRMIQIFGILLILIIVSLIILFLPFKDGSTVENLIVEFKKQNWNSKTITNLIIIIITWIFILWKVTLLILDTILYTRKKRKFEQELQQRNELNPLIPAVDRKEPMPLNTKQFNNYVEITVAAIIDATARTPQRLTGGAIYDVREIISNEKTARKHKIAQVRAILLKHGVDVENKEIIKSLKQI
ncbi:hypothetical protein BCF59_0505 [Mycoplasmopsis mustelae]|uniref:Uncharacterized protein n=1 Tax=Mycoplasmopsis mustelae TaxID=171289 RepID=A0A4R7UC71_9BACT|nr:hypothetical protein [Mycoplasmopsis mustelae]TDV23516.1 hypothetical protein BCF59_0505 [Mycoplasmopsis mustelae]